MQADDLTTPFDWHRIWWSETEPPLFLLEVAFRCIVTYLLIIATMRITGRRQVKQLSLFELSIILALGSAAGDAMFYPDVPLLHILVVFVVVVALYLLFNRLTEIYPKFSDWLEGKPVCLLADGVIVKKALDGQNLTQKELFGELRQQQVEHLGQVHKIYLEATGDISVFFFPDEQMRPGLPVFPEVIAKARQAIEQTGSYACSTCGHVERLEPASQHACLNCEEDTWVLTCATKRIT
ncbi:DUF421 domain-containing protein [Hymenobacter jejuensis]|uniref:DUF421 domain-containing protein n=1 Tax=Hymenobacter jejuensis TaxID=2502781 RepID=A0A5B8A1C4_9BACT|nr:YetF domain-containing protein [Hymenobacter jejuensis]QDA61181.1 DUF421 domain-containing protein [Hymenobacter jejuensis]